MKTPQRLIRLNDYFDFRIARRNEKLNEKSSKLGGIQILALVCKSKVFIQYNLHCFIFRLSFSHQRCTSYCNFNRA